MAQAMILVVDDEPHNLAAMRQVLSPEYRMVFARSGAEAIAVAVKHLPALILLDIQMPDLDGYSVCKALKENPLTQEIPVIFVTSLSNEVDESLGFRCGAVDYIVKPFSPAIVRARVRTHLSLVNAKRLAKSYRASIFMMGEAGHYRDTDTGVHIWRMAEYARELAVQIGWNEDDCNMIHLAAPMHDTGKLGIPDSILRKPGKLDADEWKVMKTHSRVGHDILARSDAPIFRLAAEIALRHHEKWDGSGYPDGLSGDAIPESSRIVAVADVFDALTVKRPYKEAWPNDRVVATIEESSGTHFEPRVAEAFLSIMPKIWAVKEKWDATPPTIDEENWLMQHHSD